MTVAMPRLLRRAVRRFGTAALLAATLPIPTAAIVWWVPHLQARNDNLRQAVAERAAAVAQRAASSPVTRPDADPLQSMASSLPPLSQSASDLRRVFALAKVRNVQLPKGEYQLKGDGNSALLSYSVTFPVHEQYKALKGFAADVLQALPHASMDELRMSRNDAGAGSLDSVIRFTFTYGRP
jgi:hypothetical protein